MMPEQRTKSCYNSYLNKNGDTLSREHNLYHRALIRATHNIKN